VPAKKKPPESNSVVTAQVNAAGSFFILAQKAKFVQSLCH